MLTALHIEEHEGGFLRFFRHNRLRVEHFFCDTAAVKSITYEHWRGKLGWGAIDRFVKGQRGQLLCAKDTPLPPDSAYRRFESYELSRRMSENAALYLLREVGWDVSVALIDEDGSHAGLCEELVDRARLPVVYTKAAEFYIQQAEKLLREKGAAVKISRNPSCLRDADLIVAPERISEPLDCRPSAVILSGEKPTAAQNAPVVSDYYIELPHKLRELKPDYLDDDYFASALYTLANTHELGSELFYRCGDGSVLHTRKSLAQLLEKAVDARKKPTA